MVVEEDGVGLLKNEGWMKRFKFGLGECDSNGIGRHLLSESCLRYGDREVTRAQDALMLEGFLMESDVDGRVGRRTLWAIEQWERVRGDDFYAFHFGGEKKRFEDDVDENVMAMVWG